MYIRELKCLSLERNIEEVRERLNSVMDRYAPEVTEEALYLSRKLDVLISNYYNQAEKKE